MGNKKWFVLYSKPRWEKKIDASLISKGIESWCPLNKVEKQYTDRKKIIEEPLFRSYVFVRIDETERLEVLITPGVLNFIYYLGKPAVIRDEDIETIKHYLMDSEVKIEIVSLDSFQKNSRVKVNRGVFLDAEGIVIRSSKKKAYVQLESLGQIMIVEFKKEYLKPA